VSSPSGTQTEVQIVFDIRVPGAQEVLYTPIVMERLKEAWVQYVALMIPSVYVIYFLIVGFSFKSKVLEA